MMENSKPGSAAIFRLRTNRLLAFCAFFSLIAVTGSVHIYRTYRTSREAKLHDLTAIADLKANQIRAWYGGRISGAWVMSQNRMIQRQAVHVLEHPDDMRSRQELLGWMETLRQAYGYQFIVLHDAHGIARCVVPAGTPSPAIGTGGDFQGVLRSGKIQAEDLQRDQGQKAGAVHFDTLVPVSTETDKSAAAKGVWLLRTDPYPYLYPLVESWPTPSKSAETLLVRQDGRDVLFLNELRHCPQSAVLIRRSMDLYPTLPATQAIKGRKGIVEDNDYRDVPTLAAIRRITGTPWFIVAKIDAKEFYAPLRQSIWTTALLLVAFSMIAALGMSLNRHK